MAATAADVLVETLLDWGVEIIFGMPGDGINGIMEALRQREDKIRFVQVRHEETAAFMACGYAKFTGKLGVCLATSGPGGIHLLNGLYDAKLDSQPVLAITGHQYHDLIGTFSQQDINLDHLFQDVAVYSVRVMGPTHVENVTNQACRSALGYRGVAHINFPVDTQLMEVDWKRASDRNVPEHTSSINTQHFPLPAEPDLKHAAQILNTGEKVAILAGAGALGAGEELEQMAERLGAPIIKALLGKAAVPDDSPYTTGGIGLLGTAPSVEAMRNCDTLLIVGSSFPYIEFYPEPGKARAVQIDMKPDRISLRYPAEVGLVGDSRRTLQALLPLLERRSNRDFLIKAQENMRDWSNLLEERGTRTDMPMKPQMVARELGLRLQSNAIVAGDSGTCTLWWARHIPAKEGQMHSVSGTLASMANSLPYAMAAQLAYPDRQCIAFAGDGGFSMLMADFVTAVKYDLPIKVVVIKNNTLGQIKWEQMVFLGNPEYGVELEPIDFAMVARACGGTGFTIDDQETCGKILDQALATPGPVLIEAVVDPYEPPMPAYVTLDQAKKFAQSLAKGQPKRMEIAATVAKNRIKEMV